MWMLVAAREAQDSALASLYAATVCSISRRTMGSVIAKILQVMEDDVKHSRPEKFARRLNATMAVRLVCGIMCTQPGTTFLPRYMMSLASQFEWLYDGCEQYAKYAKRPLGSSYSLSAKGAAALLRRLRRKLAVRLQLVGVIAQSKHVALTVCYRDRIVKTLFSLLATPVVATGSGLSLFSWILDLIPVVNTSVLHEKHFVRALVVCWDGWSDALTDACVPVGTRGGAASTLGAQEARVERPAAAAVRSGACAGETRRLKRIRRGAGQRARRRGPVGVARARAAAAERRRRRATDGEGSAPQPTRVPVRVVR
jgi:hypothetical protein